MNVFFRVYNLNILIIFCIVFLIFMKQEIAAWGKDLSCKYETPPAYILHPDIDILIIQETSGPLTAHRGIFRKNIGCPKKKLT